ncbi:zinc-binding dehydrogenase [Cumulibacter manganitolerans]|uniref:zinc-binding dehydrogenase n=1 Tax=Cumulibacter manganitolerans TaxID=1884992 RepID=UPI001E604E07|nr:zinc-binding dehydrogenase [Cumulibacter manganitolerans]
MATMRALVGGLGPDWELHSVPRPTAGPGEVLIEVAAAGLNRADLLRLRGTYNAALTKPGTFIGGLECAGRVIEAGPGVIGVDLGQAVMAASGGTLAEYVAVDHRHVLPVPDGVPLVEAASLMVGLATEHDALVTQGGFRAGQSVLVLGGASSVGLLGIQLAKAFDASLVIATTRSPAKVRALADAGADVVLDTGFDSFTAEVLRHTASTGVDVVLDHLGGRPLAGSVAATRVGGTIINIGRLTGPESTINVDDLAFRRIRLQGTTFSVRTAEERAGVYAALRPAVLPAVAQGRIRAVVDRVLPMDEAKAAADYMRSNRASGKVVLTIGTALDDQGG